MKAMESAKQVPQQVVQKQAGEIVGTGSVWNKDSYHWEQKNVQAWADEELKKVISGFKYNHEDAVLTINDIKSCKGDAGVTIRKGKKIVSYDYALDLGWSLKLMDINNKEKVISTCSGRYEMPEVSDQEEVKDWEVRV